MLIAAFTYEILERKGRNIISIVDLSDGGPTVTNNIGKVLEEIGKDAKIDVGQYMIIYRDSEYMWDGWDYKKNDFVFLGTLTRDLAIEKYLEYEKV